MLEIIYQLQLTNQCRQGGNWDFNVMVISIIECDIYKDNDLQNEPITDRPLSGQAGLRVNPACPDILPLLLCAKRR